MYLFLHSVLKSQEYIQTLVQSWFVMIKFNSQTSVSLFFFSFELCIYYVISVFRHL